MRGCALAGTLGATWESSELVEDEDTEILSSQQELDIAKRSEGDLISFRIMYSRLRNPGTSQSSKEQTINIVFGSSARNWEKANGRTYVNPGRRSGGPKVQERMTRDEEPL